MADLQPDQQIRLPVVIRPCEHVIRDKDLKSERAGDDMSGAHYQPVAWWFTKRLLGRELRKFYQATEGPPKLFALASKLAGTPTKTAPEYGVMAQTCLKWARNTDVDEVRETYLQLAQFWLDMGDRGEHRQAA